MKPRSLLCFVIISVFSLILLGCSQTGKTSSDASAYENSLTIAARDGSYSDVINAVKADFEKENNCSINVVSFSADGLYDSIIDSNKQDVGEYDVIMIDDPQMPEFINKNILYNLTKLGYTDDDDFVEKSRLLGKDPYPLGATYALPFSGNVQLLFYNENVLGNNADLSSWEGIYEACKQAKTAGKEGYALRGQTGNPIVSDFLPILWAFGGDIFSQNNEVVLDSVASRNALTFYCELYKTGAIYDKDGITSSLINNEAGIALGWPSWFSYEDGAPVSIATIPGKATSNSLTYTTGEIGNWLIGVTSNSSNKELALKLIVYLTSSSVQRKALKYGGVPTRISIFRDSEVLDKYPYFEYIYSGTNNSRVRPRTAKWTRIEEVFGNELVKCISGEQSVEETLSKSQAEIEALAIE